MGRKQLEAVPRRSGGYPDARTSDGQLLGWFNAGRGESAEKAFAALVGRHGPMVLRVCRQVLADWSSAEDAFQATFLVLARRSASIRRPELLGNWLYGVALRTAWEAKMREARKRRRETPFTEVTGGETATNHDLPDTTLISREEYEALHEEVSRLPERYRVPVVLCDLEGLTYQEAARRLRCPVGTVGVRLSRARETLRDRLIRRGIVPAVALTNVLFEAEAAVTSVPPALFQPTVKAAIGFAAGDAAASGLVSATALVLTKAVLRVMAMTRLKAGAGFCLAVCLTATVGWVGTHPGPWLPPLTTRLAPQNGNGSQPRLHRGMEAVPVVLAATARAAVPAPPPKAAVTAVTIKVPGGSKSEEPVVAAAELRPLVREEVMRGQMLFSKEWTVNDPLTPQGDGLGPLYNETSCVACHGLGAPGGAGPESKNVVIVTAQGRARAKALERIHPGFRGTRSTVLHHFGTDPGYATWRRRFYATPREKPSLTKEAEESVEQRISKIAQQTALGNRVRERSGRLQPAPGVTLNVSERNTPALFGLGQIDAIPSEVLVEEASRQPAGVRGRVNRGREGRVGRFGWKAQVATLHEFVRGACAGEIGLEVSGHSQPVSPVAPDKKAKGLDLGEPECDALVAYVRALPAPVAVDPAGPSGSPDIAAGRQLFAEVGCASCHAPSLGRVRGIYSDLLLHDLGQGLADDGASYGIEGPEFPGGPSPGEWRTPPLWGFRDSGPYLHDGRAQTLDEAVALHAGQGAGSAREFFSLEPEERASIETFLKSLVAPSAAATPGMILASEFESRIEPEETRRAEALVRKQREEAAARDEEIQREAKRRKRAAEAAQRAQVQYVIATNLEKGGKVAGALEFYREIVREAPDTEVGRSAVARIARIGAPSASR